MKLSPLVRYISMPLLLLWLTCVCPLMSTVIAADNVVVTDISGTKTAGELIEWSNKTITVRSDQTANLELAVVQSVTFDPPKSKKPAPTHLVWLSNGDRIFAAPTKVANDRLSITWPVLGSEKPPAIPLEKVEAIVIDLPATLNERLRFYADLDTAPAGSDVVMLANGDSTQGEFQKLDATFAELKGPAGVIKIDRSRVLAIRLNSELTAKIRPVEHRTMISLIDGSRIAATDLQLVDHQLRMKSPVLGELSLPLTSIASCQLFGDRVIPVSDLEPAKFEFTPYLTAKWSLRRNSNVLHGPLQLRGIEYPTGLGMHSRMSVTYELRGHESTFRSLVGIDDAAKGAGSVVFAVELDGRRVWTSDEINGQSQPTAVPDIALNGAKRLTLLVDFGQFADVSDYADWCDAVFILNPSR